MKRRALLTAATAFLLGSCIRFSPFQVDLSDAQQHQTEKSLARLQAIPRAQVSADAPLTLAFLADSHDGYANFGKIVSAVNGHPEVELVIHGGDLTDFGSQQEYVWAYDIFKGFNAPYLEVAGNHDGLSNGRTLYEKMFGAENFEFRYGGVHFVFLNVNTIEWQETQPDLAFLTAQVNTPAPVATVVVAHQPPYSEPHLTPAVSGQIEKILADAGVQFYLYGHVHEGFAAETVGPTAYLKTEAALTGAWLLIQTDGTNTTIGACTFEDCSFEPLPSPAPGVDPPESDAL